MKTLPPRLQTVADLVKGHLAADIGSDHAYLPIWLAQNGKTQKVYALDISEKCVERIKTNLAKFNIPHSLAEPLKSDGLSALEAADPAAAAALTDIIIAGMGGETIIEIISGIKKTAGINFILQPNTKTEILAKFLSLNNFIILSRITVREKRRMYTVLAAKKPGESEENHV